MPVLPPCVNSWWPKASWMHGIWWDQHHHFQEDKLANTLYKRIGSLKMKEWSRIFFNWCFRGLNLSHIKLISNTVPRGLPLPISHLFDLLMPQAKMVRSGTLMVSGRRWAPCCPTGEQVWFTSQGKMMKAPRLNPYMLCDYSWFDLHKILYLYKYIKLFQHSDVLILQGKRHSWALSSPGSSIGQRGCQSMVQFTVYTLNDLLYYLIFCLFYIILCYIIFYYIILYYI